MSIQVQILKFSGFEAVTVFSFNAMCLNWAQHKVIQHNDTQHNNKKHDNQYNDTQHYETRCCMSFMLSIAYFNFYAEYCCTQCHGAEYRGEIK